MLVLVVSNAALLSSTAALALAALWFQVTPSLPRDTLPSDFGSVIPRGLVPKDYVDAAPRADVLALGRALFFDPILSVDRSVSCAACHDPEHGFADPRPISPGVKGHHAVRHTPSLFNRGFGAQFSWTGRATSLEAQVLLPIENELEMGFSVAGAIDRLRADPGYAARFAAAFGRTAEASAGDTRSVDEGHPSASTLRAALAAFVGRIHHGDSAVDRFQAGDFEALDDRERAGLWVYESKGQCWRCHSGPNFSDDDFHATGVGAHDGIPLAGRFEVSADEHDRGRFKTPTLRGLALTAPFMHDGSLATIEDVIAFYRRGGNPSANLDERLTPLELDDDEAARLAAFLRALSRPAPK